MGSILYMKELRPTAAATPCSPNMYRAYETLSRRSRNCAKAF